MDSDSRAAHDEPLQLALQVIHILEDLGANAWVGGSLASSIFGIPRATQDADIIADLGWSPNSQRVISVDGGGFARVWDAASGEEVLSFKTSSTLNSVDWAPDGDLVILATLDSEPEIRRVWQSTDALVAYAEGCCVWRELTPGERQQFGLPLQ